MDSKIRKILNPKRKPLRSISSSRLNNLPKLSSHPSISQIKSKKHQFRSHSVKKPTHEIMQKNNYFKENDSKLNTVDIEEELVKLNKITERNQIIRVDWLNIQQRIIELNSSTNTIKENFNNFKPINYDHIIHKYSCNKLPNDKNLKMKIV